MPLNTQQISWKVDCRVLHIVLHQPIILYNKVNNTTLNSIIIQRKSQ